MRNLSRRSACADVSFVTIVSRLEATYQRQVDRRVPSLAVDAAAELFVDCGDLQREYEASQQGLW